MDRALAYFLTWTCYGTWLHGDARGSVDEVHNTPGELPMPPNRVRLERAAALLRNPPVSLNESARRVVKHTIEAHCAIRGWRIHAVNVRTNHIHLVLSCGDVHPDMAMDQFKSWSTRRLREAGLFTRDARIWTRYGSTKYLWNERDVEYAVKYVVEMQGLDLT